ncbi:MAG TPA: hypothetical protein VFJ72_00075 [Rubrobacteraceae bacterium]|nr:hypothetical protein [Rubrobacteraceae bacterium]
MGDKVKGLMMQYIEEMEGRSGRRPTKPVTFSMRLSERDHAKLVWLAKNLDIAKTPLAEELLKAAVDEAIEQYAGWASSDRPEDFVEEMERAIPPAPPQRAARSFGSRATSVSGTVARWKANHHGDTDGFYLKDGREIGFPPHRAAEVQDLFREGTAIEAVGEWHGERFHAYTIADTESGTRVEAHKPPRPGP